MHDSSAQNINTILRSPMAFDLHYHCASFSKKYCPEGTYPFSSGTKCCKSNYYDLTLADFYIIEVGNTPGCYNDDYIACPYGKPT